MHLLAWPAIVVAVVAALFALERARPLRVAKRALRERVGTNLTMTAAAVLTGVLVRWVALALADWTGAKQFGLVHWLRLSPVAAGAVGFLLMDLTFNLWHRLNHEVPLLWRLHNVHHVDPDLDVSTSLRFHPAEVLLSTGFRAAQVVAIGVGPGVYMAYEAVFTLATFFHHSNVRIPLGLERVLNFLVVTPRMHGIHHSAVRAETNSNYSVIFRWWDDLMRTLRLNVRQGEIDVGVPAYALEGDNSVARLLAMPFRRQRYYWMRTDGSGATTRPQVGDARRGRMLQ